ncbi:amidase [Kibdelosporangium banguiense]|uniref:Amidase n=1 Tax=Kibdelosporangium banguiense TaxID=1365924 RepID=A0ABS4TZB3_9PSEU|nr:amidase family protein [Kibdelosporangium banguiense]MBP2329255.1 amidase [Kibdelosporangium banguiense]
MKTGLSVPLRVCDPRPPGIFPNNTGGSPVFRREIATVFSAPSLKRIQQLADMLGVHLDEAEASIYREAAEEQLRAIHDFVRTPMDEQIPPVGFPGRTCGRIPTADEDPYDAWLWKCEFGGLQEGLLAGRTVGFKDHISVAGLPQTFASSAVDGLVSTCDATVVSRVLAAGGRVIGKNSMSGFMDDLKHPVNPHNPLHTTGGSSSGSAVAVAIGDVDISFGGDQGGSVRIPAAYCGVLGLKPTFGLISHFGAGFGFEPSLDHIGPLTSTVQDMARALESTAGFDSLDPRQGRDIPVKLEVLSALTTGVAGTRIGVLQEGFDEPVNPHVREGVLKAVQALRNEGAHVSTVSVPEHRSIGKIYAALALEGSRATVDTVFYGAGAKTYYPAPEITAMDQLWRDHLAEFPPRSIFSQLVAILSHQDFHGAAYAKAHNVRPAIVRAYDAAFAEVDILAMPTVRDVAPAIDEDPPGRLAAIEHDIRDRNWMSWPSTYNTKPANYTGHPALAIPCGKVDGLPISLQLVGRHGADALLLRAAYALQESVGFGSAVEPGA